MLVCRKDWGETRRWRPPRRSSIYPGPHRVRWASPLATWALLQAAGMHHGGEVGKAARQNAARASTAAGFPWSVVIRLTRVWPVCLPSRTTRKRQKPRRVRGS